MNFTFVLVQNVVHPVGLFNPVGFVNPVGLVNVNNCKLSRSTNLALNFPKILNLYNIFQTPSHTCLQVLFCLHWFNVIFFWISYYGYTYVLIFFIIWYLSRLLLFDCNSFCQFLFSFDFFLIFSQRGRKFQLFNNFYLSFFNRPTRAQD